MGSGEVGWKRNLCDCGKPPGRMEVTMVSVVLHAGIKKTDTSLLPFYRHHVST
ncbi:hypothetical protein ADIS_3860 [Lunatimonas lonarensis]|uniref:Uncharacterized protein n=1 Tax=Lunatimonas lonarensis TaxID=1232681 RepID=R7ZNF5_9BACT|nr:hypothetical protein ADIS_3860 [Lunatimonas lonarensis]